MIENIYPNLTTAERQQTLTVEADKVLDEYRYSRKLTADERNELNSKIAALTIEMDAIKTEFDDAAYNFRQQIKALKKQLSQPITESRTGFKTVTEKCFQINDQQDRKAYIYNGLGELVESKQLAPEDRQLRLSIKEGTND